jgi:hypothetical protein
MGLRPAPGTATAAGRFPVTTSFSTMVFHSPQAGQRPIHFEYSLPQLLQKNTVFDFVGIGRYCLHKYKKSPAKIAGLFLVTRVKLTS